MTDIPAALAQGLEQSLGERFTTKTAVRDHHATGEGWFEPAPPGAVCFPETNDEAAQIARLCSEHRVPMIPFGAGTSLEGHVTAPHGGVTIDLTRMNAILEINAEDLDCRVQAGVTRTQLEERLRFEGLFFPVDPGADATFGGMVGTGASGTTTVRYGTMRDNVLGLTVVLADGRTIRTGGRARKSSAGYDLTRLLVGSEGTLGLVTEIQIRLYGVPEAISAAVCQYPTVAAATRTVIAAIQSGIPLARCELLDDVGMDSCIRHSKLEGYSALPTVFYEFHGSPTAVQEQTQQVGEISDAEGGGEFRWATLTEERSALWKARHDIYFAGLALAPGKLGMATDVCVPISTLAECIDDTKRDVVEAGLVAPLIGHIGDGNFHLLILCDPADDDEVARTEHVNVRLVRRALALGGTCTGEHGIGIGKRGYLEMEHGEAVDVMRQIKQALDPQGIMNPGKIFRS